MLPVRVDDLKLVVQSIDPIADEVIALILADRTGAALPAWQPGAHIDLHLPSGLIRQYSLCGSADDLSAYRIAVLREEDGRGGSAEIHDRLAAGQEITASSPRNHFPLVKADSYLFIAGGIGITPILPMIAQVAREGAAWHLIYGGRTLPKMAFRDELAAHGEKVGVVPEDEHGLLDLDTALADKAPETPVYCCGPEPLIAALENCCEALGQAGLLHVERFGPASTEVSDGVEDTEFQVELVRSGRTLAVPVGTTLLEVVRTVVPDMPSSCETGFCGSCEVSVLHGTPLHRDTIMTDEEKERGETMMICVGRSRTPKLGLDL